jgi:hypothetical protein
MMLELLTAIRFERVMGSGRTRPCLLGCQNEAGEEVEVVTKLRGQPQLMPGGLLAEAIDETRIDEYIHSVPMEWNGQTITGEKIKTYLMECIANFKKIRYQLEAIL